MSITDHEVTRREFMRQSACAALGLTGMVNTTSMLRLTNAAVIQGNLSQVDDYKALVCVFLFGGNDSFNLLIPMGDPAQNPIRSEYEAARVHVAYENSELHALNVPSTTKAFQKHFGSGTTQMGVHPAAQPVATLFNEGDLSFVCNIGSLLHPVLSREQYYSGLIDLPPKIGAHNSQQAQWQTSVPDGPGSTGWGGRMADLMYEAYNGDASKASMSMGVGGSALFMRGTSTETFPYVPGRTGYSALHGFGSSYSNAVEANSTFAAPVYKDTYQGHRLKAMERLMKLSNTNLLQSELGTKMVNYRDAQETLGKSMDVADATGIDFDGIFSAANATTDLGTQLKLIARMIAGRSALGNRRQIFFARANGYDTHGDLFDTHSPLMQELSNSLLAFRNALKTAGDWDKTVTFTASDFGRTLSPNTDGTDHAWGGNQMVMGGPINGGELYGHFPTLKTGDVEGTLDIHDRGVLIPTTSVDQYSAPMAKWFGADSNSMEEIFPNLVRFEDPFTSSLANMQFLA